MPGAEDMIRALINCKALAPDSDSADSITDLIHTGVERLLDNPGIRKFEDHWGEYCNVSVNCDGIHVYFYQHCHGWQMRLKPILDRLSKHNTEVFLRALNGSNIQDASMWSEIVGCIDEDGRGRDWLLALEKDYPLLFGIGFSKDEGRGEIEDQQLRNSTLVESVGYAGHPSLLQLLRNFVSAQREASKEHVFGGGAVMTTSWTKDCRVNHGHDYIHEQINEGNMDNQDEPSFEFSDEDPAKIKALADVVGRYLEAITALEEWSNAHA